MNENKLHLVMLTSAITVAGLELAALLAIPFGMGRRYGDVGRPSGWPVWVTNRFE
jgi:hypothetical protein